MYKEPEAGPLTFVRSAGGRFQISTSAVTVIHTYIQGVPEAPEAGGVLLGRHIVKSRDIIVDRVTVPMLDDRRSRLRFFRARRQHQEEIDRVWRESDGTCTYLGEWHTHPEPSPEPSFVDRLEWQRKLLFDRFTEPLFFVIVGITEVRAWEGVRRGRLAQLRSHTE